MSPRDFYTLPLLALAITASTGQVAQAATKTTAVQSVVSGTAGSSYANFNITPLQASAVSTGTPIDIYFKGQLDGALRCKNLDGCGPISLAISASFNFSLPGANGSLDTFSQPFAFVSYGPTEYGDYLDLKSIKLASEPITLRYDIAQAYGFITSGLASVPAPIGFLSVGYGNVNPDGNSWQQFQNFDRFTFGLIDPTVNVHYFAAAVPEPESYAMLAAGLAALTVVRRRLKSVR